MQSDAQLFYLLSQPYEHTSVIIATDPSFGEWPSVFGDATMITTLLDRLRRKNPFDGYSFHAKKRRSRLPISTEWIRIAC